MGSLKKVGWLSGLLFSGLVWGVPWMDTQAERSLEYLKKNIAPKGTSPGVVVASPSKGSATEPDYFFHWIRDAALVMSSVVDLYLKETDSVRKSDYETTLRNYITFSLSNQNTPNPSDREQSGRLGEPKFHVDGSAFTDGWGRPQNDGPALRAITLIRLAENWLDNGKTAAVRSDLFDVATHPTLIRADLDFVQKHWSETSFDIWEETSGQHFYTRLVQRRALVEGAKLATRLGETTLAKDYEKTAAQLETSIDTHWDGKRGLIVPTLDRDRGVDYKKSDIDTAVLLGILHAEGSDGYLGSSHPRVLSTMEKQIASFAGLYPVNLKGYPATAIGRYPEDRYDGLKTGSTGNPWFLTTAAIAEMHFRVAHAIEKMSSYPRVALNEAFLKSVGAAWNVSYTGAAKNDLVALIKARGDAFLSRACFHGLPDGHLSEQINRHTGFMDGSARDLTWSYASYLTAFWQR